MFFKVKMRERDEIGKLYDFVIIEGEDLDEAYDRALGQLPRLFGDATLLADDNDPVEVKEPLKEPWPVFTSAFFERE